MNVLKLTVSSVLALAGSVLATYVRNAWGNAASPVSALDVLEAR